MTLLVLRPQLVMESPATAFGPAEGSVVSFRRRRSILVNGGGRMELGQILEPVAAGWPRVTRESG